MTILLVEQNAKLALEVSHRGYVMESGEITLAGDARGRCCTIRRCAPRTSAKRRVAPAIVPRAFAFRQRDPSPDPAPSREPAAGDPPRATPRAPCARGTPMRCACGSAVPRRLRALALVDRSSSNLALNLVPVVGVVLAQLLLPLARVRHCSTRASPPTAASRRGFAHLLAVAAARAARARRGRRGAGLDRLRRRSARRAGRRRHQHAVAGRRRRIDLRHGVWLRSTPPASSVSLPFTFVPFVALFDGAGFARRSRKATRRSRATPRRCAVLRRAVVRAADARPRDERPRAAAGAAVVGGVVVRGVEGHLRRRVTRRRAAVGAFLQESGRSSATWHEPTAMVTHKLAPFHACSTVRIPRPCPSTTLFGAHASR